jgi:hypothetical protein
VDKEDKAGLRPVRCADCLFGRAEGATVLCGRDGLRRHPGVRVYCPDFAPRAEVEEEERRFGRWLKICESCEHVRDPGPGIPAPLPNCAHPGNRRGVCEPHWCPRAGRGEA